MCFVGKERVLMKKRTRALNGKDVSFFNAVLSSMCISYCDMLLQIPVKWNCLYCGMLRQRNQVRIA